MKLQSVARKLMTSETVSATTASSEARVDTLEDYFSIQVSWKDGSTVDMALILQVSNNKEEWVDIAPTTQLIATDSGTHIWDPILTGCQFIRVKIAVTTGVADFTVEFQGKKRNN